MDFKKHVRTLLTGLLILIPFAITVWIVVAIANGVDDLGRDALNLIIPRKYWPSWGFRGVGIVIVLLVIYLTGLLARVLLFRYFLGAVERLFSHLPGVKTVYNAVKEVLKLFSADSRHMGRVVEFRPPGVGGVSLLGILTNETPIGPDCADGDQKVAVFFPMAYMIGGPVAFVCRKHLREVDMPVQKAMELCATAHIGSREAGQKSPAPTLPSEADGPDVKP